MMRAQDWCWLWRKDHSLGALFEVVWLKFLEGIDSLTYVMQLFWHFVRAAELERGAAVSC